MDNPRPPETRAAGRSGWPTAALLFALTAGYAYWRLHATEEPSERPGSTGTGDAPAASVTTATVNQGDLPIYLHGLGTVTPLQTVTIKSRVDGELVKVAFREGQTVQAGELLAEIDPRPYQVQLHQAEGQLMRDEALLSNAEQDLQRYRTLLAQDSIAAQQTATQEALVRQYRGTVEMDRAQVNNAKLQLDYTRIVAPIAGQIGLRLVDKGNIVRAGDTTGLAVITQIQPITVLFTLPEDQVPAVMRRWRSERSLTVEAFDRSGLRKLADGKLLAVDNQIDTATGTLKLKAWFDNAERGLYANQFVNIRLRLDTLPAATLAPAAAIQHGANGDFVYWVKPDRTVTIRPIKTGPVDADRVAVLEGLAPGDVLVVGGSDKLREGSRIKPADAAVSPETAPVPAR
ncbi:MdtA/MuxA family multidrug efflux RND transporter periplasmic adaptor subunit [Methylococcaceae bacterium WWC4]|nr:MdtA/MuxA family multidrug efflux RND transporter periplasmic adaptor subunit [Methylococcaceae bacterium WWC4]